MKTFQLIFTTQEKGRGIENEVSEDYHYYTKQDAMDALVKFWPGNGVMTCGVRREYVATIVYEVGCTPKVTDWSMDAEEALEKLVEEVIEVGDYDSPLFPQHRLPKWRESSRVDD